MAEETIDLIEESNDEMVNWIYYNNEQKEEGSDVLSKFVEVDANQQLEYRLMADGNEQTFKYDDCDDNLINGETHVETQQQTVGQNQVKQTHGINAETPEHNLVINETIDDNGQLVEEYFCQQCNLCFTNIEAFLSYHPYLELLDETTEEESRQEEPDAEHKLWDLVENLDEEHLDKDDNIVEIKPDFMQDGDFSQEDNISKSSVEMSKEHYFCYDCQEVFTDLETAENHDCSNELENSSDLKEPDSAVLANDDNVNVFKCHLCDKEFNLFRSFNNHQRWHRKTENLLAHSKKVPDQQTICEICNTIFASEKNRKLHMKMHKKHAVKTIQDALPAGAQEEYRDLNHFFCEICNKSFDQNLLGIHKNMHQNLEEYSCGKCNKNFENLPSYEIHMQMHEDNIRNDKAHKNFSKTNLLNQAPSTSTQLCNDDGKRKHACQYCGKEFQRPYEKVKHERIHTGEKPYECEVCGKTFRVSYSLTLHLRTHTDIRPYVCATCNKRFKQHSVYVHHLNTHKVECAYKCDICAKSFRTSVQLNGHKKTHFKPYNCTECNRPFASLYAVKMHMKTHNKCHKSNKSLINRCSICGATYARVVALSLHIKEQHGIEVDPIKLYPATSSNQQLNFINEGDDETLKSNEVNNEEVEVCISQVDHEENIQNTLSNNVYLDETEEATQTILNTEEISVDNFPAEDIIPDWLPN